MKYLYLFEDKESTPSSVLLRSCSKGNDIYFQVG